MKKLKLFTWLLCTFLALQMALLARAPAQIVIGVPTFPATNTVQITLAGTQATNSQVILFTPDLKVNRAAWMRLATGTVGQITFDLTKPTNTNAFFAAAVAPAIASTFTNFIYGYADPFLTYTNGLYYLTGTDSGYVKVISASSLGRLNSARVVSVYNAGGFFESPELHWFGSPYNHWYIYYTQYPNSVVAIESSATNPQNSYSYRATLTTNTYDCTVANINGESYLLESTYHNLVIQSMSNPYTVSSAQVPIAGLTQSWESNVIEAPEAVINPQGVLYLLYSSGTYNSANYAEGALKFRGGNPLIATNWTKLPGPLFSGTDTNGNFATATCSPFKSPNGLEDWFVYGGYATSKFTSRSTRCQQLVWNRDGSPNLGSPLPLGQQITEPANTSP